MSHEPMASPGAKTPSEHRGPRERVPIAVVVSIGDELLAGDTVNTNAAFLGTRLRRLGVVLRSVLTVRDRHAEIVAAIRQAVASADVVICSGGLGPTTDDLTTVAVADAADTDVIRDPEALERLAAKFRSFARAMPEANHKQADRPLTARWLANPIGTAEGFVVDVGKVPVFVVPGVPREMRRMTIEQIEPILRERLALRPAARRIYRLLGLGESAAAERVEAIVAAARERSPELAAMFVHYRAAMPEVMVVLEGVVGSDGRGASEAELAELDAPLLDALSPAIYGIGEADLATRVIDALRRAGKRVAFAESCTAGLASALLGAVPGASDVLDGAIVAYDNRIKFERLEVPADVLAEHGAVSEPVARAMAEGARRSLRSDLAVAITGIAGPGGATADKPVGTVHFAVSDALGTRHLKLHLRGDRGTVQRAAAAWAAKLLWDRLREQGAAEIAALEPVPLE